MITNSNLTNLRLNHLSCITLLTLALVGCSDNPVSNNDHDSADNNTEEVSPNPVPDNEQDHDSAGSGTPSSNDKSDSDGSDSSEGTTPVPPNSGDGSEGVEPDSPSQRLVYRFTRTPPPENSAPTVQQVNQEVPGRAFEIKIYKTDVDKSKLEDVTSLVTWRSATPSCTENSCYAIRDGKVISKEELRAFELIAELNGQETPKIAFESLQSLKRCDIGPRDNCLHIVEGASGAAANKQFTEPSRVGVMDLLRYHSDRSYFNTGYTFKVYASFSSLADGHQVFPVMMNSGFDNDFQSDGSVGAEGQYARYCRDLASIEFDGKNNWRRATQQELVDLSNQGMVSVYGWPDGAYSTSTIENAHSRQLQTVVLRDGFSISAYEGEAQLATCVSENDK